MEPMLDHQRRDRRDLDHLMAQRLRIFPLQVGAAAAAVLRMVLLHRIAALHRQQLRTSPGMALLATPLAATRFTASWWLEPLAVAGGWR